MEPKIDLTELQGRIAALRKAAEELEQLGADFPALARNAARILAGVRMLELNVSDAIELTGPPDPQAD